MACPICGANCRCKRRGPSGLCCSCHRHKVKRILRVDFNLGPEVENELAKVYGVTEADWIASLNKHVVVCPPCYEGRHAECVLLTGGPSCGCFDTNNKHRGDREILYADTLELGFWDDPRVYGEED